MNCKSRIFGGNIWVIAVAHALTQKKKSFRRLLPLSVQTKIADGLNVPLAEVYGVVTFYTQFSLYPKGAYKVQVCLGTACYVKGAGAILEEIEKELGIDVGKCSEDGKFSLDACRCIGACGLAPVIMINEDVYGRLVPSDIKGIIQKYKEKVD